MDTVQPTLVQELGSALREVRWRLRVSQRELAEQLGVSKTWVGRLESGEVSAAVGAVSRLVEDLGLRLALGVDDEVHAPRRAAARPADGARASVLGVVDDLREGEGAGDAVGAGDVGPVPGEADIASSLAAAALGAPLDRAPGRPRRRDAAAEAEASAQVERWRVRVERERVRDAAGRRLPAHLVAFPMSYPHHWWFLRHRGWSLRRRPIWSFVHGRPLARSVLRIGDNPPPLGLHPDGGWPMQGRPGPEVRAGWPPTFPVRPRRYADPLEAV